MSVLAWMNQGNHKEPNSQHSCWYSKFILPNTIKPLPKAV